MDFLRDRSGPARPGNRLHRRVGMQVIFLIVVVGMMLASLRLFDDPAPEDVPGDGASSPPVSVREEEAAAPEEPRPGADALPEPFSAEDPLSFGPEEAPSDSMAPGVRQLAPPAEPFVEQPEVLFAAAARDRTAGIDPAGVVDEPAVVYLLHRLLDEEASGKTPEAVLSTIRGDAVFRHLEAQPDLYRGRMVEIRGNLCREEAKRPAFRMVALPHENPTGLDRVYRSYVYDENQIFHRVYTAEDQQGRLEHLDGVVLRGYFCRLYTGDAEVGGTLRKGTIPLLVGLRYEKIPWRGGASGRYGLLRWIPIVLGFVLVTGIVIFWVSRRSESTYEARRRSGREAARPHRGGGPTQPEEAPPDG